MIVLVALKRQADALDRVGDETHRAIMIDGLKCLQHGYKIMAGKIAHEREKFSIAALFNQPVSLCGQFQKHALAKGSSALKTKRGVKLVGAGIDPVSQRLATVLVERSLHQLAVFEDHDVPAKIAEHRVELLPKSLPHNGVQRLAIIIDDPPGVAQTLFPAVDQGLVNIALVKFGVADQGDHFAFPPAFHPAMGEHVILHDRRKQRLRDPKADGAGGEVHVVSVLGARGIGLRSAKAAEILKLLARLGAKEILDGMEGRAGVWLHRDAIFRAQKSKIKRGHNSGERSGGGLMAADLEPVFVGPDMVGVVDHPRRQPQHFLLQL